MLTASQYEISTSNLIDKLEQSENMVIKDYDYIKNM